MNVVGINHVTVLVRDKQKAEEFYTHTLGFEKVNVNNRLWIKIGKQYIHLTNNSGNPHIHSFHHFALAIENLQEQLTQLVAKGLEVFDLDADRRKIMVNTNFETPQRQFFIHDFDGNLIEFIDASNPYYTSP